MNLIWREKMDITGELFALYPVFITAVIAVTCLLSMLIHELGHAVFALASGYRVSNIKLLFVSVSFGKGVVSISRNTSGLKGQCLVYDRRGEYSRPALAAVLGGSAMNFLVGALSIPLLLSADSLLGVTVAAAGAGINPVFAILNLIPKGSNDGATLAEIIRFGSENYNKLMNIASGKEFGAEYEDMDPVWFVPSTVGGSMALELRDLKLMRRREQREHRYAG